MNAINQSTKDQLKTIVDRIERLEEEKAALAADIKDVYAEAKSNGFDTKAIKTIIRLRRKPEEERQSEEMILATYMHAMGMIQQELPLGDEPQRAPKRETVRAEELEDDFRR
jgi:uncharacterized protein (UPF0335 family)